MKTSLRPIVAAMSALLIPLVGILLETLTGPALNPDGTADSGAARAGALIATSAGVLFVPLVIYFSLVGALLPAAAGLRQLVAVYLVTSVGLGGIAAFLSGPPYTLKAIALVGSSIGAGAFALLGCGFVAWRLMGPNASSGQHDPKVAASRPTTA